MADEKQMSAAEREARQMIEDKKAAAAAEAAYNKASTTPAMPAKKLAKGGVTRADGCIAKGHTRGKMV